MYAVRIAQTLTQHSAVDSHDAMLIRIAKALRLRMPSFVYTYRKCKHPCG